MANVSHMVKSMPDNVIDGVTRVGEGILSFPNSMIDGVGRILQNKSVSLTLQTFFSKYRNLIFLFVKYNLNNSIYLFSVLEIEFYI